MDAIRIATILCSIVALMASAEAQERVSFPSNDADLTKAAPTMLPGLLYRPSGPEPHPAIVLMHGCDGLYRTDGTLTPRHEDWADRFHGQGYVVLHVDSFTPRGLREICSRRERSVRAGVERARDAYGALLFLQSLPFVRAERIGLMGWSNGGSTVLWSVRDKARARPAALPRGDFRAAISFYPGCRAPLENGDGWTTRIPMQLLIGAKDDWTPAAPCEALIEREKAAGAPVELVLYPDAVHGFDAPNSRMRVRGNVATTASGTAMIGTDPQARADAITRAPAFFAKHLKD